MTPATMEQTTFSPVSPTEQTTFGQNPTGPTVTYRFADPLDPQSALTIEVSVIIFPPVVNGGDPIFEAPMIAIPGSISSSAGCDVIWTLVDGINAFTNLDFSNTTEQQGIVIPSAKHPQIPDGVGILASSVDPSTDPPASNQWRVRIQNQVSEIGSFAYTIAILYDLGNGPLSAGHDPTIVVTPEPIL
ncbi:MAG TPA: hypothetical protein VGH73_19245 [Thermoanaerobaculia bacterium]